MKHFPNVNREATLKRPILYSNWLSKDYMPVEQEKLREYVQARLKVSPLHVTYLLMTDCLCALFCNVGEFSA